MKSLKIVVISLISVPIFLIAGLLLLVLTLNPSKLLPTIETQLRAYNIDAAFKGELSWQFYPNLGLAIENLELRQIDDASPSPLVHIGEAHFSVQLMPLFKRDIQINGVALSGTSIALRTDKTGATNWQKIGGSQAETAPAPEQSSSESAAPVPNINIQSVALEILSLNIIDDQNGTQQQLENIILQSQNLNLTGKSFPLSGQLSLQLNELPKTQVNFSGNTRVHLDNKTAALEQFTLMVQLGEDSSAKINLDLATEVGWGDAVSASGSMAVKDLQPKALMKQLKIDPPPTANANALSRASFATTFDFADNRLTLKDTLLGLDSSKLTGQTLVTLAEKEDQLPAVVTEWQLDTINIDDYLPATAATEAPTPAPAEVVETPLPFDLLQQLDVIAKVTVVKFTYNAQTFDDLKLDVTSKKGLSKANISLRNAYDGNLDINSELDAQTSPAKLTANGKVNAINVGSLIKSFAEIDNIAGSASSEFSATSQGATDQSLVKNLKANLSMTSSQLILNPINIEQQFCKAMDLLSQKELSPKTWDAFTKLTPMQLNAHYEAGQLSLQEFSANIQKLKSLATGAFDTNTGKFDFPLEISLAGAGNEDTGCGVIDEKWRQYALPIRCQGSLETIGADTCLPDKNAITSLLKAKANEKLKREEDKIEAQIAEKRNEAKDKASKQAEKEAGKLVDKETSDKLEGAWKNLIKKQPK